jgi:lipopolysaccharide transport system permease protein
LQILYSIYLYRGFILESARRELKLKYNGSIIGLFWTLLNPLSMIVLYTIVFSQIMGDRIGGSNRDYSYSAHLCIGIMAWTLFQRITDGMMTMFLQNANLIKKARFPRVCLPILVTISAMVDFVAMFCLFMVFLLIFDRLPGLEILSFLPILAILTAFAAGLGVTLGVLNVFFRDTEQVFRVVAQFWFWLTPIVYPLAILPDIARDFASLNPLTPLVIGMQDALMGGQGAHWQGPQWQGLVVPAVLAVAFCLLGGYLFRRHSDDIADEL